ncbi:HU family DNA-binding protein [Candidatus Sumerlaeota bacterium]|nr:HU family DNA-binding protein [Candidatus Sumerlaeota bacterium]
MTKAVVAAKVADATGMNRKDTIDAIEIFLEAIKAALKDQRKVSLVGFGTFYVKEKNARNGRNPRTGDKIYIPPKLVATFKPGKAFREMVNKSAQPTKAS